MPPPPPFQIFNYVWIGALGVHLAVNWARKRLRERRDLRAQEDDPASRSPRDNSQDS